MAVAPLTYGQDAKLRLRDFTPTYVIDTFYLDGEPTYLKRRVIMIQQAEGIKSAYWDENSNVLTVQYNNKLVTLTVIKRFFVNNQPLASIRKSQKQICKPVFECCLNNSYSVKSKK